MLHNNSVHRSTLSLITAGVLWGTGGLAGSILATHAALHPLAVAAYRLLIGGALSTAALAGQLRTLPRTVATARRLLACGALLAAFQACYFVAVTLSSVSLATLLTIGSVPVFVAVVTAVRERRLPSAGSAVAITLAGLGLALLAGGPAAAGLAGVLVALVAGAGFAAFTLVNGNPVAGLEARATSGLGLLIGGALLLPLALPLGMHLPLTGQTVAAVAFLGAVPTALAYAAYFAGMRGARPITAALSTVLEPLTATVLSVLLLGERLGVAGTLGAVLLGVALMINYAGAVVKPAENQR